MTQKIFAIGDIHGMHDKLIELLARIPLDKATDSLVFLGDYINRGPDSQKVLDTLLQIKSEVANSVFLMGNHEHALLEYAATGDLDTLPLLRTMGVESTLASYGVSLRHLKDLNFMPFEHREFLHNLEFFYCSGRYLFTHADIDEERIKAAKASPDTLLTQRIAEAGMLYSRRMGRESIAGTGFTVVFGHLPFESPLIMPDRIGIDTGAVYGHLLTAVELPALRFYHS